MSAESTRNLVAGLRQVDEHYAQLGPARGAESRLLARFDARTSTQRRPLGLSWRTIWRPLLVVAACLMMLVITLHDEIPRAKRAYFKPLRSNVSAASTDVPAPTPKSRPQSPFHDSIVPAPGPTNEAPKNAPPRPPFMQDVPSTTEDPIDPSWPRDQRMRRIMIQRRSNPFHEPREGTSRDMSSPDLYWSTAPASKSENPMRVRGGSSRSSTEPSSDEEMSETTEPNALPVCQWPDSLKQAADLDCADKGFVLAEVTLLDPCGNGQFRRETHECAETEIEACVTDTLGDGKTCQDPGMLKSMAHEICAKAGQQLTDLVFDFSDCGGHAKMAKFTCCTPAPPPSGPPLCHESVALGDGSTCIDLGLVKQEAWDICNAEGTYLFDLQVSGDCPAGQASKIRIVCCE